MTREGHISATGNGLVFEVRGHLTLHGLNGIGSASELGCLDAPQYLSAGSVQAFRHGEYSKQGIPVQTLAWRA